MNKMVMQLELMENPGTAEQVGRFAEMIAPNFVSVTMLERRTNLSPLTVTSLFRDDIDRLIIMQMAPPLLRRGRRAQ